MAQLIKICPNCEMRSVASASFCPHCDWDLINVPAQVEVLAAPEIALQTEIAAPIEDESDFCTLESLENPQLKFEIRDGQSVGRGSRADVVLNGVPNLGWISRVHARFFRRGEQWFVQYLAQGNFIKVDGEEFNDDSEVALHDGSIVSLSLTTFVFRFRRDDRSASFHQS